MEKQKVLFVCVENACRSQMAESFANALGGEIVEAYSAGSNPASRINPDAVKVMQE
ncbi:MAG: arsenate reductase ArsC, partial [Candidatus Omnitrophica bacterium]|nr:arsenate reductase ArsC [Candidatus Omnitrophota bacterium]